MDPSNLRARGTQKLNSSDDRSWRSDAERDRHSWDDGWDDPDVDPSVVRFFRERGISREVAEARPYERWKKTDTAGVLKAFDGLSRSQVATVRRHVWQSDGWIIHRHPIAPWYPHVYPELRPDNAVWTSVRWEAHGTKFDPDTRYPDDAADPRYAFAISKKLLTEKDRDRWLDRPIRKRHNHTEPRMVDHIAAPSDWVKVELADGQVLEVNCGGHDGENVEGVHFHATRAKYTFTSKAWKWGDPWTHSHGDDGYVQEPAKLRAHLWSPTIEYPVGSGKRGHRGADDTGGGEHGHRTWIKDPDSHEADRLDVHPLAAARWSKAKRIYLVLEACIKADALLTWIIRHDLDASVGSVPSISLWGDPSLERVAEQFLIGREVVIVPDGDWDHPKNRGSVFREAMKLRSFLHRCGVEHVVVEATPPDGLIETEGGDVKGVKALDDFIADGGDPIAGMVRIDATVLGLDELIERTLLITSSRPAGVRVHRKGLTAAARLLEMLVLLTDRVERIGTVTMVSLDAIGDVIDRRSPGERGRPRPDRTDEERRRDRENAAKWAKRQFDLLLPQSEDNPRGLGWVEIVSGSRETYYNHQARRWEWTQRPVLWIAAPLTLEVKLARRDGIQPWHELWLGREEGLQVDGAPVLEPRPGQSVPAARWRIYQDGRVHAVVRDYQPPAGRRA